MRVRWLWFGRLQRASPCRHRLGAAPRVAVEQVVRLLRAPFGVFVLLARVRDRLTGFRPGGSVHLLVPFRLAYPERSRQTVEQAAPPPRAQRRQADGLAVGLAQPALVRGARRAQLAHDPAPSGSQEYVRLLAAQQPPLTHVAGDIRLGGDDRARGHRPIRLPRHAPRRTTVPRGRPTRGRSRAPGRPARPPSARDGQGPPRSAGTRACSPPAPA